MKFDYPKLGIALALCGAMSACVDKEFDLSDIDKTVRVEVDNLIIPVNLDQISLKNIIDIDEGDEHIKIIDNHYCYFSDGSFSSSAISIPAFNVAAPALRPLKFKINAIDLPDLSIPDVPIPDLSYKIEDSEPSDLKLNSHNISSDIVSIDHVDGEISIDVSLQVSDDLKNLASKMYLDGLKIQLPSGLKAKPSAFGTYDSKTGVFTLNNTSCETAKGLSLHLEFTTLEVGDHYANNTLQFTCPIYIIGGGNIELKSADIKQGAHVPHEMDINVDFIVSDFAVNTFTGQIKYNLDDVRIPEISLTDLPDVLAQSGTDLKIANPCIYIQVNNPLQQYNLYAQTGMQIKSFRTSPTPDGTYDTNAPFKIGDPIHSNGIYNFCLSPTAPTGLDAKYQHVPYTSLGQVLSGNGLPQKLQINLLDPTIPTQKVEGFTLGTNFDGINGNYEFIAPFDLVAGSTIKYADKIDGWSGDDLDHVTITNLEVNMTVTTTIPFGVKFTGYPIDVYGKRINNVSIEGANIDANAKDQQVCIKVNGAFSKLDGIEFVAMATAVDGQTLSPDMTITLTNIRPKVKGYYQDEL